MLVHLCVTWSPWSLNLNLIGGILLKTLTCFIIPGGRIHRYFSQGDIWDICILAKLRNRQWRQAQLCGLFWLFFSHSVFSFWALSLQHPLIQGVCALNNDGIVSTLSCVLTSQFFATVAPVVALGFGIASACEGWLLRIVSPSFLHLFQLENILGLFLN